MIHSMERYSNKVGCCFRIVVVSIPPHAEFGINDHRDDAPNTVKDQNYQFIFQYEPTVAVGALYTLYGLWYCQSMRKRSENDLKPRRIRISLQCWGGLNQFVQVMAKEDHTDFVAVYQRMITERVFTFSMYPTAYLLGNKWENTTEYDECSGIIYDEELHSLVNMIYCFISSLILVFILYFRIQ